MILPVPDYAKTDSLFCPHPAEDPSEVVTVSFFLLFDSGVSVWGCSFATLLDAQWGWSCQ